MQADQNEVRAQSIIDCDLAMKAASNALIGSLLHAERNANSDCYLLKLWKARDAISEVRE
jgi:hypothetical protein